MCMSLSACLCVIYVFRARRGQKRGGREEREREQERDQHISDEEAGRELALEKQPVCLTSKTPFLPLIIQFLT